MSLKSLFRSIFKSETYIQKDNSMGDRYPVSHIKVTRTLEGRLVNSIINNGGSYFFTDMSVSEDGVFDCWETVDVERLKEKLRTGWLTPQIPEGEHINIHHLGSYKVRDCKWIYSDSSYFDFLLSVVMQMNPELNNLYRFKGKDSVVVGNVNYSTYSFDKKIVRKDSDTPSFKEFVGKREHVFYKISSGEYYLASLNIYNDSVILIEGIPEIKKCTINQIKEYIDNSVLVCNLPVDAIVHIKDLGKFTVAECRYSADIYNKFSELSDIISKLNGDSTTSEICYSVYKEYLNNPGNELRDKLKKAYEDIPSHLRIYVLGDMDSKDWPIREIIYDED